MDNRSSVSDLVDSLLRGVVQLKRPENTLADSHDLRVRSWSCGLCAKWSLASEISKCCTRFGKLLGTRRSGFDMGLGSRGRAVDASGWLTLRRDRLFFSEPRYASAHGDPGGFL